MIDKSHEGFVVNLEQLREDYLRHLEVVNSGWIDAQKTLSSRMLTLSSAGLGGSMVYLEFVGSKAVTTAMLCTWVGFGLSLLCVALTAIASVLAWKRERESLDHDYNAGQLYSPSGSWQSTATVWLMGLSLVSFLVGVVSLAVYVAETT